MASDMDILVQVGADISDLTRELRQAQDNLNNLGNSSEQAGAKGALGLGKLITALGLVKVASSAFGMVKESISSAFGRIDTMEAFDAAMTAITGSAEDTKAALDKTRDAVTGTAYGLDVAAKAVQNFVVRGMDISKATEQVRVWGDAVAFYGQGSNEELATVTDALGKMLTTGKVHANQLNRIMDVGVNAVGMYAQATGQSAETVSKNLTKGKISAEQFVDTVTKAMEEGTNGVHNIAGFAKEAGGTWAGSMDNMRAAVTRGTVGIIQAIDQLLADNGLPTMRDMIKQVGVTFEESLGKIAAAIPASFSELQKLYNIIEPFVPALKGVGLGVLGLVTAFATVNTGLGIFTKVSTSVGLMGEAFNKAVGFVKNFNLAMLMNPVVLWIAAIALLVGAFVYAWNHIDGFKEGVIQVFEAILAFIQPAIDAVVAFVTQKFGELSSWWNATMPQLLEAFSNVWNAIWLVLQPIVMAIWGLIQAVFPLILIMIKSVWENVKGVISGALDIIMGVVSAFAALFTGDWKGLWEAVQQIIKGAIEFVWNLFNLMLYGRLIKGVTSLFKSITALFSAGWNAIKSTTNTVIKSIVQFFTNSFNTMRSTASNILNTIKSVFTTVFNAVWNTIKSFVTNMGNSIRNGMVNVYNAISTTLSKVGSIFSKTFDAVFTYLKGIPAKMLQIGKDIINGLIDGIKNMAGAVMSTISTITDAIPKSVKKILGIHSPSLVFAQIGKWISEGWAIGIEKSGSKVENAVRDIALTAVDIAEHYSKEELVIANKYNDEIAKIEKRSAEDIANIQKAAYAKKRKTNEQENIRIRRIQEDSDKKIKDLRAKSMKEIHDLEGKMYKEMLDETKTYIDDKKSLEQLSMAEEARVWEQSIKMFKEGSKERIKAQQEYKKAVENVNKQIVDINKNFSDKMQKINEKYVTDSGKLIDDYNNMFAGRMDSILGFANLFDEFSLTMEHSGKDLLNNLQNQVFGLEEWRTELDSLWGKVGNEDLMKQLEEMGPKALSELKALNTLSDEELTKYSQLFQRKMDIALDKVNEEMGDMKGDVVYQITQMREAANKELADLEVDWVKQIESVTKATDDGLASLEQIGIDAGKGLMDGLSSMEGSLVKTATSLAEAIKDAMAGALEINSPSRWMRNFIGKNMMFGWIDGMEAMKSSVISTARQATTWMTPKQPDVGIVGTDYFANRANAARAGVGLRDFNDNTETELGDDGLLAGAVASLEDKLTNLTIVMNGREVAKATSDDMDKELGRKRRKDARGAF